MKWPKFLTMLTPGESINQRQRKDFSQTQSFQDFLEELKRDPGSILAEDQARILKEEFGYPRLDFESPLTPSGIKQIKTTIERIRQEFEGPRRIFVSPCQVGSETVALIQNHWPETKNTRIIRDDRLRAQNLGRAALYPDPKIFMALDREQQEMVGLFGPYKYSFPQGESIADVRERTRGTIGAFVRDHGGDHILVVAPALVVQCLEANFQDGMSDDEFITSWRDERAGNGSGQISVFRNVLKNDKERLEAVYRKEHLW